MGADAGRSGPSGLHDAADLRRSPLARVKLPARIPFGFHGNGADAATMDKAIAAQPDT
jgi:carotenoid cleavage dioxygenase